MSAATPSDSTTAVLTTLRALLIPSILTRSTPLHAGVVFVDGIPIEASVLGAGASGLKCDDMHADPAALAALNPRVVRLSLSLSQLLSGLWKHSRPPALAL